MTSEHLSEKLKEQNDVPDFWPSDMMREYNIVHQLRRALDMKYQDGSNVDIHNGNDVVQYMAELQVIGGTSAELMGRLRKKLEEARGAAILAALDDRRVDFRKLSATLQKQYVDSQISAIISVYEYAEYLNKRISYALDAGRSFLSYIKEDMYNNRSIPQR